MEQRDELNSELPELSKATSRQDLDTDLEKNTPPPFNGSVTQHGAAVGAQPLLVRFDPGDPEDPKNWNPYFKAYITFEMGMLALTGSVGSSIISPAEQEVAKYLNIDLEVTVLMLALFVLGSCPRKLEAPSLLQCT